MRQQAFVGFAVAVLMQSVLSAQSPDELYAKRDQLSNARTAAAAWTALVAGPQASFEAAWKLARADYWLGGHAPAGERRGFLEQGIDAAKKAIALQPARPEGHFWTAANMGALAESFGLRAGIKYRGPIKQELEWVLEHAPAFQQGSADRALGRWYFKVPGLFGGSMKEAEAHLRQSLKYNPDSTASRVFLAEVLMDRNRLPEAREELQRVIDGPIDPEWAPEDREFQARARELLLQLNKK